MNSMLLLFVLPISTIIAINNNCPLMTYFITHAELQVHHYCCYFSY